MKDPELLMVHQNSARFYKRVAYDNNYSGLAEAIDEGKRLGEALGESVEGKENKGNYCSFITKKTCH